jgi:hypothetical protein
MLATSNGYQGLGPGMTFTMAEGGSHEAECTIQLTDNDGNAVTGVFLLNIWLTKANTGVITDDAPQANFTVDTSGADGILLYPLSATTSLHIIMQTNVSGYCVVSLTDSGDVAYKIAAEDPRTGLVWVSDDWVNYG